jgi:hypothetical protein
MMDAGNERVNVSHACRHGKATATWRTDDSRLFGRKRISDGNFCNVARPSDIAETAVRR